MARPTWKGTLSFGLVSIAVELHTMEAPERLDLDLLDKRDMGRVGYQKINKSTGDTVPTSEIVKGYAVAKNKYVLLTDADFKAANPKATRTIDVIGFVDADEIDRIYYARPYLVAPASGGAKAYRLLHDVLEDTGRVALARIVLHTREHTAALYPHEDGLVLQLLRYERDLRSAKDIGVDLPEKATARAAEKQMAEQLIEAMAAEWDPESFKDTYRDDLMKLIKSRAKKGAKDTQEPPEPDKDETPVLDLMAALKRSLGQQKKSESNGAGSKRANGKSRAAHHRAAAKRARSA